MALDDGRIDLEQPVATREDWLAEVEAVLKGAPFEKRLVTRTPEGLAVEPLYGAHHLPADPAAMPTSPGVFPFTRGGSPAPGWETRQEHSSAAPAEVRDAIGADLALGATSVWLSLDAACRRGLDPDHPRAAPLVGVGGTAISHVEDLATALEPLDLARQAVSLESGPAGLPALALLFAVAERQGVSLGELRGSVGCDPLGTLAGAGSLPCSLDHSLAVMADMAAWCSKEAPGLRAALVSTTPYSAAGAGAVWELAAALATGVAYLRAMEVAGLPPAAAARQILFSFSVGRDLFMEVARLRAARTLWSRVLEAAGVVGDHASPMLIHARTSPWTVSARDPWVNLLRATTETFAAAVGGADTIHTGAFDRALGQPTPFSRRVAANTQVLLQEEGHLHRVADPGGGSWYVERLTLDIEEAAWASFQEIESQGGIAAALRSGALKAKVEEVASLKARRIASRTDAITGVSEFPLLEEKPPPRPGPAPAGLASDLAAPLKAWRDRHPPGDVSRRLEQTGPEAGALTAAATLAAAAGATWGALSSAAGLTSEPDAVEPLRSWRASEPFERLREASDRHLREHGRRPAAFLANMGPLSSFKARADFTRNLLAAGGIVASGGEGFETEESAAEAFRKAATPVAILCSSDKLYPEVVPAVAGALRQAGARRVLVAGRAGEREQEWRDAGVDGFIFLGCDALDVLGVLHQVLGVVR